MQRKLDEWFLIFWVFSFCGWVYEFFVFLIEDGKIVNRGFLWEPALIVYGFGSLLIVPWMSSLKDRWKAPKGLKMASFFAIGTLIAATVELIASYVAEFFCGKGNWLWDYSGEFLNFQGRIALIPDLKFGLLILLGVYVVYPILQKGIHWGKRKHQKVYWIFVGLLAAGFVTDLAVHLLIGSNWK